MTIGSGPGASLPGTGGLGGGPRAKEGHVHSPVAPGNNTVPFLAFYIGTNYLWSQHNHNILSEKSSLQKSTVTSFL